MLDQESLRQAILSEIVGSPPLPRAQRLASYRSIIARAEKAAIRDGSDNRQRRTIVNSVYEQCADVEYEVFGGVLDRNEVISEFKQRPSAPAEDEFAFDSVEEAPRRRRMPAPEPDLEFDDDEEDDLPPPPRRRGGGRREPEPRARFEDDLDDEEDEWPAAPPPRRRQRAEVPLEDDEWEDDGPIRRGSRRSRQAPEPSEPEDIGVQGPADPDLGISRGRKAWGFDDDEDDSRKRRKRGGGFVRFLVTFLTVILLAGGGFYAWQYMFPEQPRQVFGTINDALFGEGGILRQAGLGESSATSDEPVVEIDEPQPTPEPVPAANPDPEPAPAEEPARQVRSVGGTQPLSTGAGTPLNVPGGAAAPAGPLPSAVALAVDDFEFLRNDAHTVTLTEAQDGVVIASTSAFGGLPADKQGNWLVLANDVEQALSGHRVKITIEARAAQANGSDSFAVNYLTVGHGGSGWRLFPLFDRFVDYSFEYSIPEQPGETTSVDLIGLNGDPGGQGRAMEVRSVTIEPVS